MSASDSPTQSRIDDSSAWAAPPRRDLSGQAIGDFRIDRLLGRGGMGEVYLAQQISLDRPVALKVIKPELISNPTVLARFEKEAQSAAKLNHANIVHVYFVGITDEIRYIAMEYVQGTNLKDYLARRGIPDLPLALSIMRQASLAVAAAGEVGLVHRDIKPENLLLTRKGLVKVADFGLCRMQADPDRLALTQEGVTLGTPMYMSPEQVQGHDLDHRSDLYSLGVTFYHMLAGKPPFVAETPIAIALKQVQETPVHLAVHRPDLPPELSAMVMKLMAKDPAARYVSASEIVREVVRIREQVAASSATLADSPSTPSTRPSSSVELITTPQTLVDTSPSTSFLPRFQSPRLWLVLLLSAVAGALLGARGRAENLLAARSPRSLTPPGLWLANWESVPKQDSAEAQYRYAQMQAPEFDRDAAWLAVPGYTPEATGWTTKAYVQLVRLWFRQKDRDRLDALARSLESAPESTDRDLPGICRAAAALLRDDMDGMLKQYEQIQIDERQKPSLNELSLELMIAARRHVDKFMAQANQLRRLEDKLTIALQIQALMRFDSVNPERPGLARAR